MATGEQRSDSAQHGAKATQESGAGGGVDPRLLNRYLTLQIEALEIQKKARRRHAAKKARRKQFVWTFGPPAVAILALVLVGAITARVDSQARLSAAFMHPPQFLDQLANAWKVGPHPPSPDAFLRIFSRLAGTGGDSRTLNGISLSHQIDTALKVLSGFRGVIPSLLELLAPVPLGVGVILLDQAISRLTGAVIGTLLTLAMAALLLAAAVASSDLRLTTVLVLALIGFCIYGITARLATLALEVSPPQPSHGRWLRAFNERYQVAVRLGRAFELASHPLDHAELRTIFVASPVLACCEMLASIVIPDVGLSGGSQAASFLTELPVFIILVWLLWASVAASRIPGFFHPLDKAVTRRLFLLAPVGLYALMMVEMAVGDVEYYSDASNRIVGDLSGWSFLGSTVLFGLWAVWAVISGTKSRYFLHPWQRRATMVTFIVLPIALIIAVIGGSLLLAATEAAPSWWSFDLIISLLICVAAFVIWCLWLVAVVFRLIDFRHPLRHRRNATVFFLIPAISLIVMLANWSSANQYGSAIYEFAAIIFGAWWVWAFIIALRDRRWFRPTQGSAMARPFIAIPWATLVVLLATVVTFPTIASSRDAWLSLPGFIWSVIFGIAALSFFLWCIWAWLILPGPLRTVFGPILIFFVAGIVIGPMLLTLTLAVLLAIAIPGPLLRSTQGLRRSLPIVNTSEPSHSALARGEIHG